MPKVYVDPFSSFDELYHYWRKAEQVKTPFRAVLLSTELAGLDRRVTHFVLDNIGELNDMSGDSCAMFIATPRKISTLALPPGLEIQYKEISYSIGRLLQIPPDHFPAVVFFDTLIHPKQMVIVLLSPILGQEPTDAAIVSFFRSLFTITQELKHIPDEKRLPELKKAIEKRWSNNKRQDINFAKVIKTTLSLSEIAKNIVGMVANVLASR
ncbi:MAG: hypothetical protein N2117_00720 [Anaerolineales bacterium]|nr:hypothetical protein [Anaerolineales bacterium]